MTYPLVIPLGGSAVKVLEGAATTGMGSFNTASTAAYTLAVPANALAGAYTATWTYTVGTAP